MSYFSRIQLKEEHPRAREALLRSLRANPYADHQWLWQFFPAAQDAPRDFLFRRFEPRAGRGQPVFYVVSARPPEPIHEAWAVESKAYEPELENGATLTFDLRANPVQSRKRDGKSKRDDVVMHAKWQVRAKEGALTSSPKHGRTPYEFAHEAVREWFCGADGHAGVAARHGFAVDVSRLGVDSYQQHRIRRGQQEIRFSSVDLSGVLLVTDADRFRQMLLHGLGKAKAFGCGLLLVRRTDQSRGNSEGRFE